MRSHEEVTVRDLSREEIAAMYVFHDEYAAQGGGGIEFWQTLIPYRKRVVQELLAQLDKAGNPVRAGKPHELGDEEAPHVPTT